MALRYPLLQDPCGSCGGKGKRGGNACQDCAGSGRVTRAPGPVTRRSQGGEVVVQGAPDDPAIDLAKRVTRTG